MSKFEDPSFYEIVELDNGDIALRRSAANEEPLVTIRFSAESNDYLGAARFEVAKTMLEAGLDIVAQMDEEEESDESPPAARLLH